MAAPGLLFMNLTYRQWQKTELTSFLHYSAALPSRDRKKSISKHELRGRLGVSVCGHWYTLNSDFPLQKCCRAPLMSHGTPNHSCVKMHLFSADQPCFSLNVTFHIIFSADNFSLIFNAEGYGSPQCHNLEQILICFLTLTFWTTISSLLFKKSKNVYYMSFMSDIGHFFCTYHVDQSSFYTDCRCGCHSVNIAWFSTQMFAWWKPCSSMQSMHRPIFCQILTRSTLP